MPSTPSAGDHAELVAAKPVDRPGLADRDVQTVSEPGEQCVSGRVPERVVVALEAVEIESSTPSGCAGVERGSSLIEVLDELPSIAEAGERVGESVLARAHPTTGHRGPDQQDSKQRERDRERVDAHQARGANPRGPEATMIQSFSEPGLLRGAGRRHGGCRSLRTPSPVAPASLRNRVSAGTPSAEPVCCGERLSSTTPPVRASRTVISKRLSERAERATKALAIRRSAAAGTGPKSLRITITLRSRCAPSAHPHLVYELASVIGFKPLRQLM